MTSKSAADDKSYCKTHGGVKRCREDDCFELVALGSRYCRRYPQGAQPNDAQQGAHTGTACG